MDLRGFIEIREFHPLRLQLAKVIPWIGSPSEWLTAFHSITFELTGSNQACKQRELTFSQLLSSASLVLVRQLGSQAILTSQDLNSS